MRRGKRVFILTGAGVSAESGLGTFRDTDGIWAKFDPMQLARPEAFAGDPDRVHEFYNARRGNLLASRPNTAHDALAQLEQGLKQCGGDLFLCTQNIDDLHERAGSTNVHHMHGELLKGLCTRCGDRSDWREDMWAATSCPSCDEAGGFRPDVVWFGEMPYGLETIDAALARADLFVAIGTSGAVYPAAGLVHAARAQGIATCEINLNSSDNAQIFDDRVYGEATTTVPQYVAKLLNTA